MKLTMRKGLCIYILSLRRRMIGVNISKQPFVSSPFTTTTKQINIFEDFFKSSKAILSESLENLKNVISRRIEISVQLIHIIIEINVYIALFFDVTQSDVDEYLYIVMYATGLQYCPIPRKGYCVQINRMF